MCGSCSHARGRRGKPTWAACRGWCRSCNGPTRAGDGDHGMICIGRTCFDVLEPVIAELLAIGVVAAAGIEQHGFTDFCLDHDGGGPRLAVYL